jgi:hypothetical protein
MLRATLMTTTLLFASSTYAACEPDALEIGDTGPASQRVCEMLEARFPRSNISIVDREIYSGNSVEVIASVDGQKESLTYQLVGADWALAEPTLASGF